MKTAGDKDWASFTKRFKNAVLQGLFHIVDMSSRECKVIVDNEVHSRTGSSQSSLETIEIDMYPVNHASRSEKTTDFMFEVKIGKKKEVMPLPQTFGGAKQ